jgi:hypothetical protein
VDLEEIRSEAERLRDVILDEVQEAADKSLSTD